MLPRKIELGYRVRYISGTKHYLSNGCPSWSDNQAFNNSENENPSKD